MRKAVSFIPEPEAHEFLDNFRAQARKLLARFRIPAQDAEDLLQDTLLLYLDCNPDVPCVESWLQGTLKNRCLVYWRERRRQFYQTMDLALLDSLAEPTAPSQEHRIYLDEVISHLDHLTGPCASLLKLRYQSDFKPSQLADRLGYGRRGIYKILERCVAALSRRLLVARRRPV
ncbi:MAG: sigma-70 family RNA polymerase sigma factor [Acidobacteria bacterium]|nr:sigma-70 family RNA polymerase sigma factor [Acidobacteriota bacterium]